MKNWSRQLLSVLIMTGSLSALPATAQVPLMDRNAQAPLMRLVNVRAEATREVANDQMEAQVYTELSNSSAAALATQINQTINRALTLSRNARSVRPWNSPRRCPDIAVLTPPHRHPCAVIPLITAPPRAAGKP